jgi:hypothetical protein
MMRCDLGVKSPVHISTSPGVANADFTSLENRLGLPRRLGRA